jgi:benzoyl-CoA 2,3-dioxygenase component B
MLERHSGDPDRPRILNAFNEKTPDWLSFFMFTYFTDRDGKYQLASLAESGFDPLSRTCRFMLTEEAHHMFVGESGLRRVIQRSCAIMNQHKTEEVRKFGVVDLPTVQKYLNFHFSASIDLFGQELSTNAANYYTMGLKGRFQETRIDDDHRLGEARYPVSEVRGGAIITGEAPALTAVNERLRDDYSVDCQRGVDKWNRVIRDAGIDFELQIPHRAFNRKVGSFAGIRSTPEGRIITEARWDRQQADWLPSAEDQAYVQSLMAPVTEPGKMANWIAAPAKGIDGQALDFEYVRFN